MSYAHHGCLFSLGSVGYVDASLGSFVLARKGPQNRSFCLTGGCVGTFFDGMYGLSWHLRIGTGGGADEKVLILSLLSQATAFFPRSKDRHPTVTHSLVWASIGSLAFLHEHMPEISFSSLKISFVM